jgi:hypothetical protein
MVEVTNADSKVETVQIFPSSIPRKENHVVAATRCNRL